MDKKEFFKIANEKTGITKEEFKTVYDECEKEIKSRGATTNIEAQALALLHAKLKKRLQSPAKLFTGVIFGKSGIIDYGAKQRKEALKIWAENKERAISEGFTDKDGNPLYQKGFEGKKGTKIDANDVGRTIMLVAKLKDGTDEPRLTYLSLRGDKCNLEVPEFKAVEFMANINKNTTETTYFLNQSMMTEFKVVDDKEINFPEFAAKNLRSHCVPLISLREYHQKTAEDFNRFAIFRANVSDIMISDLGYNTAVRLDEEDLPFDENIVGWLPKDAKVNFPEGALGLFFVGQTRLGEDGRLSLNLYSVYVPQNYRITETKKIEVEDTDEW